MKQFASPLGMSTLHADLFDEILGHVSTKTGWSSTEHFLLFTSRVDGESTLTTTGEEGYYQKRSGGKILQHIFSKELWDKGKAWAYLEGLAEKAITYKLRFEDMEPVKLAEIDDKDLEEDHDRLHRYYAEWLEGEHRDDDDWTFGDLLQKHVFVVAELEKRGKRCEYDDGLAKPIRKSLVERIGEAVESFVWEGWDEPVLIVKGGPGSGHHGHAGRPGSVGGSAPGGGGFGGLDPTKDAARLNEWADSEFGSWYESLDRDERWAISSFTGGAYESINKRLREGQELGPYEEHVGLLDSSLSRGTFSESLTAYRAVRQMEDVRGRDVGDVVRDKGFVSTTLLKKVAESHVRTMAGEAGGVVEIRIPRGSRGAFVGFELIGASNEFEVLLPRNSQFKLISKGTIPVLDLDRI